MNKRKFVLCCCLLLIVALASYLGNRLAVSPNEIKPTIAEDSANNGGSLDGIRAIPSVGPLDMLDTETAAEYGITGYLSFGVSPTTPKQLYVSGGEASVTLLLKFISFREDITEADVVFGSGSSGLRIEVPYGNRLLCLNDLVTYEPSGTVKVKANQILEVNMIIKVPADYPHVSFPLGAVGVTSNVPISDGVDVTAYV
jgi:hypothetical protein